MAVVSDILKLLETWPAWTRLKAAPDRVDALEKRIAAMEAALAQRPARTAERDGPMTGDDRAWVRGHVTALQSAALMLATEFALSGARPKAVPIETTRARLLLLRQRLLKDFSTRLAEIEAVAPGAGPSFEQQIEVMAAELQNWAAALDPGPSSSTD